MSGVDIAAYGVMVPLFTAAWLVVLILGIVHRVWQVYAGAAWSLLLVGAFFLFGFGFDWFPETADEHGCTDPDHPCYCEGYQDGTIKQPASTWSDLAFVAGGLLILYLVGTGRSGGSNPMADPGSGFPVTYGMIVIFMGPASMLLHASLKNWGGWFDNLSIVLWLTFALFYSVMRVARAGPKEDTGRFLLLAALFGGLFVGLEIFHWFVPGARQWSLVVLGAGLVVWEFVVWFSSTNGVSREPWLLVVSLAIFVVAMGIWLISGGVADVWCPPESAFQPHALWHVLAAGLTVSLFFYYRSEARA